MQLSGTVQNLDLIILSDMRLYCFRYLSLKDCFPYPNNRTELEFNGHFCAGQGVIHNPAYLVVDSCEGDSGGPVTI